MTVDDTTVDDMTADYTTLGDVTFSNDGASEETVVNEDGCQLLNTPALVSSQLALMPWAISI